MNQPSEIPKPKRSYTRKIQPPIRMQVTYEYALETKQLRAIRILAEMLQAARARHVPASPPESTRQAA